MEENKNNGEFSVDDILNEYSSPNDKQVEIDRIISETEHKAAELSGAEPVSEPVDSPVSESAVEEIAAGSVDEPVDKLGDEFVEESVSEPVEESVEETAESVNEAEEEFADTQMSDNDDETVRTQGAGAPFTLRTAEDNDETKRKTAQSEYEGPKDKIRVAAQIERLKKTLSVRAAVLLFASVFSVFITAANDLNLPLAAVFDRTVNPSAYLFTNTILGIISVGFSYSVITMGIKAIFSRRADSDSVAAVNMIAAIIAGLATLFDPEPLKTGFFHLYTSAAMIGMLFNTLGKLSVVRRTQRNFEFISTAKNISAAELIGDDHAAPYITDGTAGRRKELAAMRITEVPADFMKNSYSADLADRYAEKTLPFAMCAALIVGLMSIAFEKNSASVNDKLFVFLASVSGTLSICTSYALTLIVNLPLSSVSRRLIDYSGVMLGYSSAEDYADVNSIIIDAGHLFPSGTVEFSNLKMLGGMMIDECIIYAASLASAGRSVTRPAFYKMLRGDTDMLLDVDMLGYENNQGILGRIKGKQALFGSRSLMEAHGIEGLPDEAEQDRFADPSRVIYLAVSGKAVMMFAVTLSVGAAAERWVGELEDASVEINVRCADGFITRELISNLFNISASTVKLIPTAYEDDYVRLTAPTERVSSSMLCSGHLPTFAMMLIAARKVKFAANLGVGIQYAAMLLGAGIAAVMMVIGSFSQITPTIVIIYNLAFGLLTYLMQSIRRI